MIAETDEEFMKRMELKMRTENELLKLKIAEKDKEISSLINQITTLNQQYAEND